MTLESTSGAVYDRGYRPYEGRRGRRGAAFYALYKASIRRALGLRRSWRQKIAPFLLLGIVTIPAIVNVGIAYVTRNDVFTNGRERIEIITYREYVGVSAALLLFVALVAPDVICPDRRQHVLPLLFARPMTGVDYVGAKLAAIGSIVFAFSFLPQVVLFVGNMLVSNSALDYLTGHLDVLWKIPIAVALLGDLLRGHRGGDLVAVRPAHRRGRVDHRPVPHHVDRVRDHGRAPSGERVRRRLGGRAPQRPAPPVRAARPRVPRAHRPAGTAQRCQRRRCCSRSSPTSRSSWSAIAILLRRYRWVER